jgi:hypothetical protein
MSTAVSSSIIGGLQQPMSTPNPIAFSNFIYYIGYQSYLPDCHQQVGRFSPSTLEHIVFRDICQGLKMDESTMSHELTDTLFAFHHNTHN